MLQYTTGFRTNSGLVNAISEQIWDNKYRLVHPDAPAEPTIAHSWSRVAKALTACERPEIREKITQGFFNAMQGHRLLPAGRILAGAGAPRDVTLVNTFVMSEIEDSMDGVMRVVTEAAATLRMGGGIGFDFSTLRPKGFAIAGLNSGACGPLAAMDVCDSMCAMMIESSRRGAMMAVMRCDHPDIEAFVDAKTNQSRYRNFNLSVLVSDAFMAAVDQDAAWPLVWNGEVVRTIQAKTLWALIMKRNYEAAEPGVLFIDRINALNPLNYMEEISATNSCAEQPLPPCGSAPLASVNLSQLVSRPFEANARLDVIALAELTAQAVRMLDNVLDVSRYPTEAQREEAQAKRRIGVGVTGAADALVMLGETYGSPRAAMLLEHWMKLLRHAAVRASIALAKEKGAFPAFEAEPYCASPAIQALDAEVQVAIATHGVRNALTVSIAPTGSISLLAGNVSSGVEPIFATSYKRKIIQPNGVKTEEIVRDYAVTRYRLKFGEEAQLPETFVTAQTCAPERHVAMQAAAQKWVDSAISKTVNCPEDIDFDAFRGVYDLAYRSGCKGCTTYRPNAITGSVLSV